MFGLVVITALYIHGEKEIQPNLSLNPYQPCLRSVKARVLNPGNVIGPNPAHIILRFSRFGTIKQDPTRNRALDSVILHNCFLLLTSFVHVFFSWTWDKF